MLKKNILKCKSETECLYNLNKFIGYVKPIRVF